MAADGRVRLDYTGCLADRVGGAGVEAGKVASYALMGRAGYEEQARRLRAEARRPRAVV